MQQSYRAREIVRHGDVQIDLIHEGSGPPIVLLPSRGRDSEDFNEIAAGLAEAGFRVLRPQPRGALLSTGPGSGVRMQDLAADVAHVIAHDGSGPAIVAGHAFGSWVARMLATSHPHLVRGVVLLAAAAKAYPPELHAVVAAAGNRRLAVAERLAALRRGFFTPAGDPATWLTGWADGAIEIQAAAVKATPQDAYWTAGTAPLLDIIAEHDPFRPRGTWQDSIAAFGDRATVRVVPAASHALIPEQPDAVVGEITHWARRLPGSS